MHFRAKSSKCLVLPSAMVSANLLDLMLEQIAGTHIDKSLRSSQTSEFEQTWKVSGSSS